MQGSPFSILLNSLSPKLCQSQPLWQSILHEHFKSDQFTGQRWMKLDGECFSQVVRHQCSLFTPIDHSSPSNLTTLRASYQLSQRIANQTKIKPRFQCVLPVSLSISDTTPPATNNDLTLSSYIPIQPPVLVDENSPHMP